MLRVVVVLLFSVLVQGLTKVSDQFPLWKIEMTVTTP